MKVEGFAELFRFEDFIIDKITCFADFVQIALHRDCRRTLRCPYCDHRMGVNKTVIREVFELPIDTASSVKVVFRACSKWVWRQMPTK